MPVRRGITAGPALRLLTRRDGDSGPTSETAFPGRAAFGAKSGSHARSATLAGGEAEGTAIPVGRLPHEGVSATPASAWSRSAKEAKPYIGRGSPG